MHAAAGPPPRLGGPARRGKPSTSRVAADAHEAGLLVVGRPAGVGPATENVGPDQEVRPPSPTTPGQVGRPSRAARPPSGSGRRPPAARRRRRAPFVGRSCRAGRRPPGAPPSARGVGSPSRQSVSRIRSSASRAARVLPPRKARGPPSSASWRSNDGGSAGRAHAARPQPPARLAAQQPRPSAPPIAGGLAGRSEDPGGREEVPGAARERGGRRPGRVASRSIAPLSAPPPDWPGERDARPRVAAERRERCSAEPSSAPPCLVRARPPVAAVGRRRPAAKLGGGAASPSRARAGKFDGDERPGPRPRPVRAPVRTARRPPTPPRSRRRGFQTSTGRSPRRPWRCQPQRSKAQALLVGRGPAPPGG